MCFDWTWFAHLLILIVIVCAVVAILKVLLPMVFAQIGSPGGALLRIIDIFIWAVVAIFVIYVAFELIGCLAGGGLNLGLAPRR